MAAEVTKEPLDLEHVAPAGECRHVRTSVWARKLLRQLAAAACVAILALAGAGVAVTVFGARTYHWRAFDIEAGIRPAAQGETRLVFAPLGEVRARTHRTPLALEVRLRGISFDAMRSLLESPPPRKQLEAEFQRTARQDLQDMARWQVALGALGALVVAALLRLRRARYWISCAALGGVFVAAMFGATLRTFNGRAFASPNYTGSLREASWIIAIVKDAFVKAETLSDKLRRVAGSLDTLYTRIDALPGLVDEQNTLHVLHISDIHNNPAAVAFVQELAARTKADIVVDTGDLTDFGTPLEARLSRIAASVKVPYVFVAGNHDSQATIKAVSANRNAIILNGAPVTVEGLTFLGSPDPSALRPGPGSVDTAPEALRSAGQALLTAFDSARIKPDMVCVHDPAQAQPLVGIAPLILCGHEHRIYLDEQGPTVICNAGTTGAAGARYFDRKQGVPFSAAILAFTKTEPPRLLYVDQVVLDGSLGQYSVSRRSFGAGQPLR